MNHREADLVIQSAANELRHFVLSQGGATSNEEAARMLRRALELHPRQVPGALTPYDALRVLCRKWLAKQLPATKWPEPQCRAQARALANQTAAKLAPSTESLLQMPTLHFEQSAAEHNSEVEKASDSVDTGAS